jgi:hypothetical protein
MDKIQKGGKNSVNIQAEEINFNLPSETDKRDFGIIDEIFKSVIEKLKASKITIDKTHININEKIELNFHSKEDRERVQKYFKYAYTKVSLIENRIREEDSEIQNDLAGQIFGKYNLLKDEGLQNVQILEGLFEQFTIPNKKDNPEYINLARAFVLFFLDDCTIFEKISAEKK